ncbi:unnamed protein product, partial [Didymodactylos carnosus]
GSAAESNCPCHRNFRYLIEDSELVQEFLSVDVYERDSVAVDVEIKILLPGQTICAVK